MVKVIIQEKASSCRVDVNRIKRSRCIHKQEAMQYTELRNSGHLASLPCHLFGCMPGIITGLGYHCLSSFIWDVSQKNASQTRP